MDMPGSNRSTSAQSSTATRRRNTVECMAAMAQGSFADFVQAKQWNLDMIGQEIDLTAREDEWDRTPLLIAAARGDEQDVELLIDESDVDAVDCEGQTALIHAAFNSDGAAMIARLLRSGASPGIRDVHDRDALCCAIAFCNEECVRALVGACDTLAADSSGLTPLMRVATSMGSPERAICCARILIPLSDLGALDKDGMSALDYARRRDGGVAAILLAAAELRALRRCVPSFRARRLGACGPRDDDRQVSRPLESSPSRPDESAPATISGSSGPRILRL